MKKSLWIAMAGALAVSVLAASAQEVLSANTIGYIKKQLPEGGRLITVSVPLLSMVEGSNVFGRTSFAQEAPVGSVVYFWNVTNQTWISGSKTEVLGSIRWPTAISNRVIAGGEFVFIKGPNAAEPVEITIAGEVPTATTLIRALPGDNAIGAVANPYPADFVFGKSSLALNASVGSVVYFWNITNQTWVSGSKTEVLGSIRWPTAISNRVVQATEGFFLKEAGTITTWTNAKPYTWP